MSGKQKKISGAGGEEGSLLSSLRRIFRGSTKGSNKLNRVKSHKPQARTSVEGMGSVVVVHRSRSEPDLRGANNDTGPFLRQLAELKCTSITEPGELVQCPAKAAKRLGLDQSTPTARQEKDLSLAANMPQKAAKTLGVCTVNLKAAKTLGITTTAPDGSGGGGVRYQTAEDFLRKIGAHSPARSAPSLRKQKTSPALPNKNTALLRRLAEMGTETDRKRRQVGERPGERTEPEKTLPDKPASPVARKLPTPTLLNTSQSAPGGAGEPVRPPLAINKRLLLKKCESDTRLIVPNRITRHSEMKNTIVMVASQTLMDGAETPAIILTPAPTVLKLYKKGSLSDVLRGRRAAKLANKSPSTSAR